MSVWEYKVISSGKGGFASPALLEKFLGDLGRDEWEIIHYQTLPENPLAFSGLARRPTQRDWTLEDAAAAAAKVETEKLRAEFEAKFKSATMGGAAEERPASFLEEKVAPDDGFRKPVDTSHDADADDEEEVKADEWDKLTAAEEDELPTFFDAIRPHMRRNQRGPGMAVGIDYLAKKWDQSEEDLKGALVECGFVIPEDEDAKPEYLEYDGDLYWLNQNRRGELWINTKEKPRPVFRSVKAEKAIVEEPVKSEPEGRKAEDRGRRGEDRRQGTGDRGQEAGDSGQLTVDSGEKTESRSETGELQTPNSELQTGPDLAAASPDLLNRIRPLMRRNRRGPGGSGSSSFLARALKVKETDLKAAFTGLGLVMPASPSDKPVYTEIANQMWWLNLDSRGGLWINGREKRPSDEPGAKPEAPELTEATAPSPEEPGAGSAPSAASVGGLPPVIILGSLRSRLKPGRGGTLSAKVEGLAEEIGQALDELVSHLVAAGLKLPEKPREKPVQVESAGENFWLSRTAKGELWLNAKPAKADGSSGDEGESSGEGSSEGDTKPRRSRTRKKTEAGDVGAAEATAEG